ncbi:MAG: Txe/YoeB family addiction module toxin [Clostridiales bacterium]|nr:Txe/YoeB family addiction module toxin [Clostridiales bacterium]
MNKLFTENGWEDYMYWQLTDKKMVKKINSIIKDIERNPYEGIGKPEPLRFDLAGLWSRRINSEHRLIYKIEGNSMFILACRHHYDV